MTGCMPDWATMPANIKGKLRGHLSAIRQELEAIERLGEAHPQSEFRMGNILKNAREFLDITLRVEGANKADFYAYECRRKEQK